MHNTRSICLLTPLILLATTAANPIRIGVQPFDSIKLQGGDTIELVRGPTSVIVTHADPDTLAKLRVETVDGVLNIGRKPNACKWPTGCNGRASFRIAIPQLSGLTLQGSGTVHGDGIAARTLSVVIQGSGTARLEQLDADQTKIEIDGSGIVEVTGRSEVLSLVTNGGGTLDASGLIAGQASAQTNGGGAIRAHATDNATVRASAGGSIRIAGTRNCQITRVGHADIVCGNDA